MCPEHGQPQPAPAGNAWVLLVFARVPALGVVKTRIAATTGNSEALRIYRDLGTRVVNQVQTCSALVKVVHTPDSGAHDIGAWLGHRTHTTKQGEGNIGVRMERAVATELKAGAERVVVIGTDCPDITAPLVNSAFVALGVQDVVLGPATDGGYYLVGVNHSAARQALPALFRDIPWSSPDTLAVTRARLVRNALSFVEVETLSDVDTQQDWERWQQRERLQAAVVPRIVRGKGFG